MVCNAWWGSYTAGVPPLEKEKSNSPCAQANSDSDASDPGIGSDNVNDGR